MSKISQIFSCSKCGAQALKWSGRCLECGAWGSLEQDIRDKKNEKTVAVKPAAFIDLRKIGDLKEKRIKTGIGEVDQVLGGGFVPGSLILLSGEPGIGKSTILAQMVDAIGDVIYVSGEESAIQVKNRLERLHCDLSKIKFVGEINVEKILATVKEHKPCLLVVDSIQTVYSVAVDSQIGGVGQIQACAMSFLEMAKKYDVTVILVGHITKDGQVAGPKLLEHIVDTVLYLECENKNDFRILRSTKNRFGSINELGVFEMTAAGFKEIKNPGAVFLETNEEKGPGSLITVIMQGNQPFLVEIQALVSKTFFGYPQRKSSGFDPNRLQVLAAVLNKRAGINLNNQDIILNVVGGIKINDPGLDLAVCLAIVSSFLNQEMDKKTVVIGEVGLGGEIRKINKLEQRLKEAKKLGFDKAIIPKDKINFSKLDLIIAKNLQEIINKLWRA